MSECIDNKRKPDNNNKRKPEDNKKRKQDNNNQRKPDQTTVCVVCERCSICNYNPCLCNIRCTNCNLLNYNYNEPYNSCKCCAKCLKYYCICNSDCVVPDFVYNFEYDISDDENELWEYYRIESCEYCQKHFLLNF